MRDYLRTGPQVCEKAKSAAVTAERSARALAVGSANVTLWFTGLTLAVPE